MRCPYCLTDLILDGAERYETLSEHVGNPNATPPFRRAFKCPKGCHSGFFGEWGALYGRRKGYNVDDDYWYAVNSFNWQLENWDRWDSVYRFYEVMNGFDFEVIFNEKIYKSNKKIDRKIIFWTVSLCTVVAIIVLHELGVL